ncbi:MAG: putative hydrolase of the superfamily [Candidatus Woesearchaeota archaeon]|nr:putative hydrolase of the superfamily [Candidatus Woesearchaeota archaeon]
MEAVIFDFDNTLEFWNVASNKAERKLIQDVAKEAKVSRLKLEESFKRNKEYYLLNGKTPALFSRVFWMRKSLEELNAHLSLSEIHKHIDAFWKDCEKNVRLYDGAEELLKYLKANGIKLGLISDSDGLKRYKINRIKRLGIKKYFDVILTTDDVGYNKPHRAIFIEALKRLDVKPKKTWMVGDNPRSDCYGAKHVGINTICVLRGTWKSFFSHPEREKQYARYIDYRIDNLKEVKRFFKKIIEEDNKK